MQSFSKGVWWMTLLVVAPNTGEIWIFSMFTVKHEWHREPGHRARQENKTTGRVCLGSVFQEKLQNQSVPESISNNHSISPEPCPDTTGNQDVGEPCETQFMSKYSVKGYLKCYTGLSSSQFFHLISYLKDAYIPYEIPGWGYFHSLFTPLLFGALLCNHHHSHSLFHHPLHSPASAVFGALIFGATNQCWASAGHRAGHCSKCFSVQDRTCDPY